MKTWARWTVLILWTLLLLTTSTYWNPFTSFPALLKYSVVSVVAAAIFGALILLIQWYILLSIIFPLPPRADSKAPKGFFKSALPFLFKKPPIDPKAPTRLDELVGNDHAKLEIKEVIDMLSNPGKYTESGATVPRGMLFIGPPGVGKTLFARAIANEVGVPFFVIEGGAISGLIMGLGVLKLKTLFRKLKTYPKAILFIDEIDSMGARRQRDRGMGGIADMNMTLNTLLTEMDGFYGSNLLVIGATNNDGMLDPALMRAGRMDRRIYFQSPTPDERKGLFRYYLKKVRCNLPEPGTPGDMVTKDGDFSKSVAPDAKVVDLDELAMLTANYSPAEIAGVVNEAALIANRPGNEGCVTTEIVKQALDRVSVGLERTDVGAGLEITNHDPTIRLDHVIGIDDVKQDVLEIVDFLRRGDELRKIGAKVPKGLLLVGPPGVGKTMLAKAIANEAGVPFFGFSGSYFVSAFEGSGRLRALYTQARKSPASIVFIDEIDALGGTVTVTGSERTSALNQILVELDGIGRSNVITIGATNVEEKLDPAFTRSGRFDRKAYIGLPDAEARKKIFQQYLKNIRLATELDLDKLATITTNFSGADIAAAVNEAAIIAIRHGGKHVEEIDLEDAVERIAVTAGNKLNTGGMSLAKVPDLDVTLDDVKGMDGAKAEAAEVVALLKNVDKVLAAGLKAPRGVLLAGYPGTGKTMLAKAIANEAGVPFYALSGGDFQSMWAGVGANRVRAVYEQARRSGKPCIVFIDEIDAIGAKRGVDLGGGAIQDSNKTLNQLLSEMDGFGRHKVLTIGATNNLSALDKALLRPGRFDRIIQIPLPNLDAREAIVESYLKKTKLDETVNALDVARMTVFKSGADLANIVNEAGLIAIRHGRTMLNSTDLIEAVQRVSFGMSYSQNVIKEELMAVAFHEAGHAVVSYFRDRKERIQVLTVVPTGQALGYLWGVQKDDFRTTSKFEYMTEIEVSLGGYAAEELYLESTSSGPSSDLHNVARVAKRMIREWGMGTFKFNTNSAFAYGHQYMDEYSDVPPSPETAREIELEIKKLVDDCLENVRKLLVTHRQQLDQLAYALVEKETLYFKDIVNILEPEKTNDDIDREIRELAERKMVGKVPILNLEAIRNLPSPNRRRGNTNGNGNGNHNGAESGDGKEEPAKPKEEPAKADASEGTSSDSSTKSDTGDDATSKS
jgi:ATP-dependent metalloprotease FtsH